MICAIMDGELSGCADFNYFVREGKTKLCAFLNGDDDAFPSILGSARRVSQPHRGTAN